MKHDVLTEEQINEFGLLEPGVYDFEIVKATEKVSRAGNPMFELQLNVYDKEGKPRSMRDWIMPSFPKKYKHIHDACGLLDLYQSGETKPENLEGKAGKLMLDIGDPQTNDKGFEVRYNQVEDYVKKDNLETHKKALDDEIPF